MIRRAPSSVCSGFFLVILCALSSTSYLFNGSTRIGALAQTTTAPGAPSCSACEPGLVIGAPDNQVQDAIFGDRIACSELDERAAQGSYDALQCRIVQVYVQ